MIFTTFLSITLHEGASDVLQSLPLLHQREVVDFMDLQRSYLESFHLEESAYLGEVPQQLDYNQASLAFPILAWAYQALATLVAFLATSYQA